MAAAGRSAASLLLVLCVSCAVGLAGAAQQQGTCAAPSEMVVVPAKPMAYCDDGSGKLVTELRFTGNIAPFFKASVLRMDIPVTVSWSGGTFDLDTTAAFMAGTCYAESVGFFAVGGSNATLAGLAAANNATLTGLAAVNCLKPIDWPSNVPWPPPPVQIAFDAYSILPETSGSAPVFVDLPRAQVVKPAEYRPRLSIRNTTAWLCPAASSVSATFTYDGEFLSSSAPTAYATALLADGSSAFDVGVRCAADVAGAGNVVTVTCSMPAGSSLPPTLASISLSLVTSSDGLCEAASAVDASATAQITAVPSAGGPLSVSPTSAALACSSLPVTASFSLAAAAPDTALVLEASLDNAITCNTTVTGPLRSASVFVSCPPLLGAGFMPGARTVTLKARSGCFVAQAERTVNIVPPPLLQLRGLAAVRSASCSSSVSADFSYSASEFGGGTTVFKPAAPGARCVARPASVEGCVSGVNVTVTCTKRDGSAFGDGTSVPISLVAEYSVAACAPQSTGAVLQHVPTTCCQQASAYAFAGAASTCIQARLPNDTRCINQQASSWQAFNKGPQPRAVLQSGITKSCSTAGGRELGTVSATCDNSRLMRFNVTTAAPGPQVWLAVGCKRPTSLPSAAQGSIPSRAAAAAGCNRFRRLPDNDKAANTYQLAIKPGHTSFVWQLTQEACDCSDLWWAVHTQGLYASAC